MDNQSAFLDRAKTITGSVLEYALTSDPGLYLVDTSATDTPISGVWYYAKIYDVFSGHRIVELYSGAAQGHQEIYYNTYNPNDSKWKGWALIATANPPQEYDLPLAEGITTTQHCVYYKNQFDEVSVRGVANGSIINSTIIATLPAGFRPAHAMELPATFAADGDRPAGTISVNPDGTIRAQVESVSFAVIFSASFIAWS